MTNGCGLATEQENSLMVEAGKEGLLALLRDSRWSVG